MSVDEPLGPLTYMRIWHDNSGEGASKSWYLNMITVIDMKTHEKWSFICNNWLALEKGDGQVDRLLPVASNDDMISFSHLFTQSFKKKLNDSHLWISVVSRPTRSSFTRLQRVSCCMSLLFCTMIANAMFYQADKHVSSKSGVIELGPLKFTLTQLYTSFISTLIVLPVNLIIVMLFRKAKLKINRLHPKIDSVYVAKKQFWRRIKTIQSHQSWSPNNFSLDENEEKKNVSIFRKLRCKKSKSNKTKFGMEYKRENDNDKKQGRWLPHWTIYIAWLLIFVSITVPAFFVILYSMEWGRERSNAWLISMFFSFFQSLFVIDPVKVFLLTALVACIIKKVDDADSENDTDSDDLLGHSMHDWVVDHEDEHDEDDGHVARRLSQIEIEEIERSRRVKLANLPTLDPYYLKVQREKRIKDVKMAEILKEMATYAVFLAIVLFLAYQGRPTNGYRVHKDLVATFLTNPALPFHNIRTIGDTWDYVENVFIPGLYASTWYNGSRLKWKEKLTLANRYSLRVGSPRIRQLRIKENTCIVPDKVKHIINHCRDAYNWIDDDTNDYGIGWTRLTNESLLSNSSSTTQEADVKMRNTKYTCKNAWCYQNTLQTKSFPIVGTITTYKGGGYAVNLGRSVERSRELVRALRDESWLDQLTRAVFFEFTVYNPNVNLFASVTLIVESLPTGSAALFQSIDVFLLYDYLGSFGLIVLAFHIAFVVYLVYFTIGEIVKLSEQGLGGYLGSFWNWNDLAIIVASVVAVVMYVTRSICAHLAIRAVFESELGEFVNFNTIAQWDVVYSNVAAAIVFCATLKFLKLLRFNPKISMLSSTLAFASRDLAGFSATFAIVFFAFTQFSMVIFGSHSSAYRDFYAALASAFRFALGQFDLKQMQHASYVYGSIYFFLFIFFVVMGLMSMFITILNEAFDKCKKQLANKKNEYELAEYFKEKIKGWKGVKKANHSNRIDALLDNDKENNVVGLSMKKITDYEKFYSTSSLKRVGQQTEL